MEWSRCLKIFTQNLIINENNHFDKFKLGKY
jgi:hypothetical protein